MIRVNDPDLVLFVGEALVGNEAVDQLVKFNEALADHYTTTPPRLVDGIILTKFDTVDTKVGAAISMVYSTGQPIVFVGCGQVSLLWAWSTGTLSLTHTPSANRPTPICASCACPMSFRLF